MSDCISHTTKDAITYPWASYQIHKIARWACAGNAGNVFPTTGGGENVPGACATRNFTYLARGPYPNHSYTMPVAAVISAQITKYMERTFIHCFCYTTFIIAYHVPLFKFCSNTTIGNILFGNGKYLVLMLLPFLYFSVAISRKIRLRYICFRNHW